MSDLTKFEGWELDTTSTDDPRVRDVDVAACGGMKRPRDVRQLIERNASELAKYGELSHRCTVQRYETRPGVWRERTVSEFWLNEGQSLALVTLMRTERAAVVRHQLITLYLSYRRGQLAAPASVSLDIAHGPRLGEVPNLKADSSALCAMTARASGSTLARVHGFVRKTYRVPGIHHLAVVLWPAVKQTLEQIALGHVNIGGPVRRQLPADRRQVSMPWSAN